MLTLAGRRLAARSRGGNRFHPGERSCGGSGGIDFPETAGSLVIQQQALRGDIDGNCIVDVADMIAVRDRQLADPGSPGYLDADLNGDGRVNVLDLILVRNLLGRRCE
ncbi:MAG TPA: dockerin type I domain-containing protein [Phycisphaerae bacterium]|nr:dockerin type I domain-containing protein [Phycisphaerae bacterium]